MAKICVASTLEPRFRVPVALFVGVCILPEQRSFDSTLVVGFVFFLTEYDRFQDTKAVLKSAERFEK